MNPRILDLRIRFNSVRATETEQSTSDSILLAGAYETVPVSQEWNRSADLKVHDVIGIYNVMLLANHHNQHG